ncbi:tryptophan 2,3-dioxygenase family protein [Candidatus Uabimicrobium sp. HlEnr_7]|uniref:tryptophan 2,3-dioxygenase family protein n=1 Tax=Candidatus Uabimicrobium helgolandensis TaxID=3095367 RepID=UPI0035570166
MKKYPPAYYSDYLGLDKLLSSQELLSEKYGYPAHDEMLFVIVHQAYELWFRQIIHELDSIINMFKHDYIDEVNIGITVSRLARVTEIQKLLIEQLRILETMTSLDFLDFRNFITPASGFQSVQFRLIENKLGLHPQQRAMLNKKGYRSHFAEEHQKMLQESEEQSSLFELVEKWLERTPFLESEGFNFWESYKEAVITMLDEDKQTIIDNPIISEEKRQKELKAHEDTRENFRAIFDQEKHDELVKKNLRRLSFRATHAALFIHLYRDQPILQQPFKFLTLLVDIDELMTAWRYRHALMVLRMIGTKIGTGGTSGHDYLKMTVEKSKVYQDLFNMATFFIPRSTLPPLPDEIKEKLGFFYTAQH